MVPSPTRRLCSRQCHGLTLNRCTYPTHVKTVSRITGPFQQPVDRVVTVRRVMMEQGKFYNRGLMCYLECIGDGAVSPVAPLCELLGGEIGRASCRERV